MEMEDVPGQIDGFSSLVSPAVKVLQQMVARDRAPPFDPNVPHTRTPPLHLCPSLRSLRRCPCRRTLSLSLLPFLTGIHLQQLLPSSILEWYRPRKIWGEPVDGVCGGFDAASSLQSRYEKHQSWGLRRKSVRHTAGKKGAWNLTVVS